MNEPMNERQNPKHEQEEALDQLLDKSLAQYSQAEPLAGFEERILARLEDAAAQPEPGLIGRMIATVGGWFGIDADQPFAGQRLAGAVTAVVLVIGIAVGMFLVTRPGEDIDYTAEGTKIDVKGDSSVETTTAPLPAVIPQEAFRASSEKLAGIFAANPVVKLAPPESSPGTTNAEPTTKAPANTETNAKQEVFPAPAPLTEQERLALAYARNSQYFPVAATMAAALPEPGISELEVPMLQVAPIKVEELEKPVAPVETNTNRSK